MTVTVYGEAAMHVVSEIRPQPDIALCRVEVTVGGPGAVVSRQLALLGRSPRFVGVCGDDFAGRLIVAELEQSGVDCREVVAVGRTARIVAVVGEGSVELAADVGSSWDASTWCRFPPDPSPGLAYITGFPPMVPTIIELGRRGYRMTVDAGFIPLLAQPDRLLSHIGQIAFAMETCIISGAELTERTHEAIRDMCFQHGVGTLVITLGIDGVIVMTPTSRVHLPAREAKAIDPLCAGDVFVAGYLSAIIGGLEVVDAARYGQAVAAAKVGMFGRLPSLAEITQ